MLNSFHGYRLCVANPNRTNPRREAADFPLKSPRLFPIEFKCAAGHSGSREKRRVGVRGPKEVSMADLPEAINPERKAQIDTVG